MSTTTVNTLGSRVRQLREERGLSQTQLAAQAAISQSGVSNVEHGLAPAPGALVRLAVALGTTPEDLTAGVRA